MLFLFIIIIIIIIIINKEKSATAKNYIIFISIFHFFFGSLEHPEFPAPAGHVHFKVATSIICSINGIIV